MSSLSSIVNRLSVPSGSLRIPVLQRLLRACAGLCLAACAMIATAQTQVGGPVAVDTLWLAAQGPYIVNADITVGNGAVLTIEAGSVVYMNAGVNLIVNNGTLRAKGTSGAPIVITAASDIQAGSPTPGSWGQIVFQDNSNDANTIIEWAQIRYGSGLRLEAASPTLNNLTIQNHAGPAISIDLKSSPAGVGLKASGNTLNGISVPAGEIVDSVKWLLQGIPYVITQGEVSVGKKPAITAINPASIQQGMTTDAVITGTRLAGVESVSFDAAGVTAILSAGATDTAIPLKITVSDTQALGNVTFAVQTAAGRVSYDAGVAIIATKPTIGITDIAPSSLRRSENKNVQITGSSLQGAQVNAPAGSGLVISNLVTSATQATFTLAASAGATLGAQALTVTNPLIANSNIATVTVNPVLPVIYTTPSQLTVPPDAVAHTFQLKLVNSDTSAHTINLATGDPTIAAISPALVTIPAGSMSVNITLTGLKLGITSLNLTSPTLAPLSVQVYASNLVQNGTVIGPVVSPVFWVDRQTNQADLPQGMTIGPVASGWVGVDRSINASISIPPGTTIGPVASGWVGVDRAINANIAIPPGTSIGPVASGWVGVDRADNATISIPPGTTIGPVASGWVGVDRAINTVISLPMGTVIGPIVSPLVGADR